MDAAGADGACGPPPARPLQDRHPRSRPAPSRACGAEGLRPADERRPAARLFEEWVEKCLLPTLSQGDVVVMDNLPAHKGARVEQLIKSAGAKLRYLPPYSPDMNPIEKAFSKLKADLRKIAERTVAGLMRRSPRMTRGRCGSLHLHRRGLSPHTSCRSPGAPVHPITGKPYTGIVDRSVALVRDSR